MSIDWSISPTMGWLFLTLALALIVWLMVVEVADWSDNHREFLQRHFDRFLH